MDKHRAQLQKLSEADPDFHEFLKEQDADLLDFEESDYESDEEQKEELELNEPQEDVSDGDEDVEKIVVTSKFIADLSKGLMKKSGGQLKGYIQVGIRCFIKCVSRLSGSNDEEDVIIDSDQMFDATLRCCLMNISVALLRLLKVEEKKSDGISRTLLRNWKKYKYIAKKYLTTLSAFLDEIATGDAVIAALHTLAQSTYLYVHLPKLRRLFVKKLAQIWSHNSLDERRAAFTAIHELCLASRDNFASIYKCFYLAYVSSSRNVAGRSWECLLFMRQTFAQLTYLYPALSYQYVFVYIRQFAIHLRNAKIAKRKDTIKTIYNWQYILGLYLWTEVIVDARKHRGEGDSIRWIQELVYPLVQVLIGVLNATIAPRYLPLRIHCVKLLLYLQSSCKVFIPTLIISTNLLHDLAVIDQKPPSSAKAVQKQSEIRDLIRLSQEMISDVRYRQRVAKELSELCADAVEQIKDHTAFSDICVPVKNVVKAFLRECRNTQHKKLFASTLKQMKRPN